MLKLTLSAYTETEYPCNPGDFVADIGKLIHLEQVDSAPKGVIVSATTPKPEDEDKVWFKVSGDSTYQGTYVFTKNNWENISFPTGARIVVRNLRANDIPYGWTLVEDAELFPFAGQKLVVGHVKETGADVPEGWSLCDGTGSTPDLQGSFISDTYVFIMREFPSSEENAGAYEVAVLEYTGA